MTFVANRQRSALTTPRMEAMDNFQRLFQPLQRTKSAEVTVLLEVACPALHSYRIHQHSYQMSLLNLLQSSATFYLTKPRSFIRAILLNSVLFLIVPGLFGCLVLVNMERRPNMKTAILRNLVKISFWQLVFV
jgi:hypothetical protein